MSTLKKQPHDPAQVRLYLDGAENRRKTANAVLPIDAEAALQIAYEAMVKAALALMLSRGVRPRSQPGHHIAMIEFAEKELGQASQGLLDLFDRIRRKRNTSLYEAGGIVTEAEATEAIDAAEKLIATVSAAVGQ